MPVSCPHCGAELPIPTVLRMATGTGMSPRCRGCSRLVGLSRVWERSYAVCCWLTLCACFVFSTMEHSYLPYLGTLVVFSVGSLLAFRAKLRVVFPKPSWFPVLNVGALSIFFCTMVYANPL